MLMNKRSTFAWSIRQSVPGVWNPGQSGLQCCVFSEFSHKGDDSCYGLMILRTISCQSYGDQIVQACADEATTATLVITRNPSTG